MLMRKIQDHNEVNGFVFTAVEFALIALAILPFGIYYLSHARAGAGFVAVGIAANALTIVAIAVRSSLANEKMIGIARWFDREGRTLIAARYPQITRDTMVLTAVTLLPFAVPLCWVYEAIRSDARR